jgi:hypothetical protein
MNITSRTETRRVASCLPLMESIQGIVVGAEIVRRCLTANRSIEHPAQGRAINDAALNTKTNHATGELIHHDENPMRSQRCGFTAEQIATPQTVLHVARNVSQDGPPESGPNLLPKPLAERSCGALGGQSQARAARPYHRPERAPSQAAVVRVRFLLS